MDIKSALSVIEKGVDFLEEASKNFDEISVFGAGYALQSVTTITLIINNVNERIKESKIVADSTDQALIRDYAARLSAVNDKLADQIEKS